MLLEFKLENFRSFHHETILPLLATSQSEHADFFNKEQAGRRRVLPSAVIFGPNASGKTNLVLALAAFREMVTEGHIRLEKTSQYLKFLELHPFIHEIEKFQQPVKWETVFLIDKKEYTYGVEVLANLMAESNKFTRVIIAEYLKIDDIPIFERNQQQVKLRTEPKALRQYTKKVDAKLLKTLEKQSQQNLDDRGLFLAGAFKNVIDHQLAGKIIGWFSEKLVTIIDFPETDSLPGINADMAEDEMELQNKIMQALLKHADFGTKEVAYLKKSGSDPSQGTAKLHTCFDIKGEDGNIHLEIPSILMESKGTLKFLKFVQPLIATLHQGKTLVVDELDASMHPDLVTAVIGVFNNPHINRRGAQLIFNTHNPAYLNRHIFRRDQIFFVQKDPETLESELYSLADFKTAGTKGVRKDENYKKNYLEGKYGSLPLIDIADEIRKALEAIDNRESIHKREATNTNLFISPKIIPKT